MTNPLLGVYLNNRFYDFVQDSYKENFTIRNSVTDTNSTPNVLATGSSYSTFTITLDLANTYNVKHGSSNVGQTTWLGLSRYTDLKTFTGAKGLSLSFLFVAPYGVTYNVVPVGQLDTQLFNPDNPSTTGMEFRVSLSLAQV